MSIIIITLWKKIHCPPVQNSPCDVCLGWKLLVRKYKRYFHKMQQSKKKNYLQIIYNYHNNKRAVPPLAKRNCEHKTIWKTQSVQITGYMFIYPCLYSFRSELWLIRSTAECCWKRHMWPWTTKPVLSRWGIFIAIAKNILYGSKLLIFIYGKNN